MISPIQKLIDAIKNKLNCTKSLEVQVTIFITSDKLTKQHYGVIANQTLSNLIGKVLQLGIKVCREFYLLPLDMNPSHQARYQQKGGRVLGRRFGR